jgi:osmotically-inducible protein OsmY
VISCYKNVIQVKYGETILSQIPFIHFTGHVMNKLFASAAIVLAATLTGCADMKITPAGPVPDTRIQNPETALADRVRDQLASMKASHLKVAVKGSEVTLSGDVENGQQLARIAIAVQQLAGVTAVIPDLNPKN